MDVLETEKLFNSLVPTITKIWEKDIKSNILKINDTCDVLTNIILHENYKSKIYLTYIYKTNSDNFVCRKTEINPSKEVYIPIFVLSTKKIYLEFETTPKSKVRFQGYELSNTDKLYMIKIIYNKNKL